LCTFVCACARPIQNHCNHSAITPWTRNCVLARLIRLIKINLRCVSSGWCSIICVNMFMKRLKKTSVHCKCFKYVSYVRDHGVYMYVVYIRKWSFAHALGGSQWCGIIHYYWWTASIKPKLLFSRAGYASWELSLSSVLFI